MSDGIHDSPLNITGGPMPTSGAPSAATSLLAALFEKYRVADECVQERQNAIAERDLILQNLKRVRNEAWDKYKTEQIRQAANK